MFLPVLVPDATPEATVKGLVEALDAKDLPAVFRRVEGGKPFGVGYAVRWPIWSLVLGDAKVDGDAATVDADIRADDGKAYHETVQLRRTDGDWRIVPAPKVDEGTLRRPITMLATIAANPELMTRAQKAAKRTVDLSNVKQVALAALQYAVDHNDRLPTTKGFKAAIMPYLRNAEILTAPGAPKGTVSYFLDPRLSGRLSTSISRPAETAMILEGTPSKTAFPWSGRTPVGYVDGHAKTVDATQVYRARTISLR